MSWPLWIMGAVAAVAFLSALNQRSHTGWQAIALRTGLEVAAFPPMAPELRGQVRGFPVVVVQTQNRIAVRIPEVDPWFTLGRDNAVTRMIKPDIETGDPEFDDLIRIEGDRDFALGLLNQEARRAVVEVVTELDGKVENGQMEVTVGSIERVPDVLEPMVDLAEALVRPSSNDLPQRLAQSALEDSSQGFRLQAFRQLASEFIGAPELRSTARELLRAKSVAVRLEAAASLLVEGDPDEKDFAARELVEQAAERVLEAPLRRRALESLTRTDRTDDVVYICRKILLERLDEPPEVRRAALAGLVEAGAVDVLVAVEPMGDPTEAEALARGLGRLGDPRAQPLLLDLLGDLEEQVRTAAAIALGAVGDAAAVEPLREAAGSRSVVLSPLARAVETAVQQIQSRLGGAQAGEISLAAVAPLAGAVSPAGDSESSGGGEVSLTEEQPP